MTHYKKHKYKGINNKLNIKIAIQTFRINRFN